MQGKKEVERVTLKELFSSSEPLGYTWVLTAWKGAPTNIGTRVLVTRPVKIFCERSPRLRDEANFYLS